MKKISDILVRHLLQPRDPESYKNTYGKVLIIGGNSQMGGAILLSASAAVHSGAGLITTVTDPVNRSALHSRLPESMFLSYTDTEAVQEAVRQSDVILLGPGLGRDEQALQIMHDVMKNVEYRQCLILDGDALTLLAENQYPFPESEIILTPHLGEWEKLSGLTPEKENMEDNQTAVKKLNAVVVLKKHRTEIYANGDVWQNPGGNAAMATGGMGDTLAGMIAGFVAQYRYSRSAILSAVYLHSQIGDTLAKTQHVVLPTDIIKQIPRTMKQYEFQQLPKL